MEEKTKEYCCTKCGAIIESGYKNSMLCIFCFGTIVEIDKDLIGETKDVIWRRYLYESDEYDERLFRLRKEVDNLIKISIDMAFKKKDCTRINRQIDDKARSIVSHILYERKKEIDEKYPDLPDNHNEWAEKRAKNRQIDSQVRCPKCGSTQITTGTRGWSLFTGLIGSGTVYNMCAKCGNKWKAGK